MWENIKWGGNDVIWHGESWLRFLALFVMLLCALIGSVVLLKKDRSFTAWLFCLGGVIALSAIFTSQASYALISGGSLSLSGAKYLLYQKIDLVSIWTMYAGGIAALAGFMVYAMRLPQRAGRPGSYGNSPDDHASGRSKRLIIGGMALLGALLVWFVPWLFGGFLHYDEVCTTCGRVQETHRYFWIPKTTVRAKPLSNFYDSMHSEGDHRHHWLFGFGHGGAVEAIAGDGRQLYDAINNEHNVTLLEKILKLKGRNAAEVWLEHLLMPDKSRDMNSATYLLREDASFEEAYSDAVKRYNLPIPEIDE
jgi:predicted membrane channel-forming protein YqfA (hemolysin III family)